MSRMTYKYQATIPKQVREALALGAGDYIQFVLTDGGEVSLHKAAPIDADLHALEATLASEWGSKEDDDAYAGL